MAKINRFDMRDIEKRFGATVALTNVDLAVPAGEVHALIGENGAGKSTLMKILSGALHSDAGTMHLNGDPYRPETPLDARHKGIAMIYQELSLAAHLTVTENILLGLEPTRFGFLRRAEMRQTVTFALARLNHPDIHPDARVGDLSIAAQQLVEIARALAVECQVLVLDEPTSSLTQTDVQRLFQLIRQLRNQGLAIVYISHFLEEVQQVADRFTVLRDGKTVGTGAIETVTTSDLVHLMVGRQINDLFPRSTRTPGDPILDIRALSGIKRPENATLTLRQGEILGIAGLVGSGRTELLRTLFGLDPVRTGQITFALWSGTASPSDRLTQGMGLLSEDRKEEGLATNMTVADNLTLSRLDNFGPKGILFPKPQYAAAQTWIDRLGIRTTGPNQTAAHLSGGNQQKVALARLLHHNVDCLLLDEPTRGIDIASKAEIYRLIDQLAAQGKAILLVSSYLPELLGICDLIAVMHRGYLGPVHPVDQCDEHSLMLEATGGDQ